MQTRIRERAARPHAGRTWLLALVVVGIVWMHGLSAGGAHASHADPPSDTALSGAAVAGHHEVMDDATGGSHDSSDSSFVMLCVVMVLALALGLSLFRRTTWVSSLAHAPARLTLPVAPLLRDQTPVPRFTVMRC